VTWPSMETRIVTDAQLWEMFASADEEGSSYPLRHFGPLGYAQQDTTAKRILHVTLTDVDPQEAEPEDYWAWLDHGASQPSCIGATEDAMTQRFLLGEDVPGPREEERLGQGRILRLRVSVIEEMFLRSGRRNWKISSAL
jgi:hypothetical protein